ncbi:acyl-CoA dehydrogenase [Pseudomonas kitaguniensis]|uniref:acyl-CoA dehydrogenase n=1 Tax=Pseudomonas kitaguniensis TaxID=2607908 RepID=UPI003CFBE157
MNFNESQFAEEASALLSTDPLRTARGRERVFDLIARSCVAREKGDLDTRTAVAFLRDLGVGLLRVPIQEGGFGFSLAELIAFAVDLGAADSSIAQILRNHYAYVEQALKSRGNVLYERGLDAVKEGKLIGLGATELGVAQAGTMKSDTTLIRQGGEYRLNGRKFYSTGNMYSDLIRVYATLDGELVSAMVPADRSGISFKDDWDGFGQSRTASGTTLLNDVTVYAEEIYPALEQVKLPFGATFPQVYLTAIVVGILRNIEQDAVAVLKLRDRNFYHAVAELPVEDPLLQQTVGRISSILYVAESAVLRAAQTLGIAFDAAIDGSINFDDFEKASAHVAKTKVVVDDLALESASALFNVAGASATSRAKHLDRHWRNIRTLVSHNPVSYKARAIGDHLINGTPLPSAGFF